MANIKKGNTQNPTKNDDLYFTPKMLAKIDHSLQEIKEGKVQTLTPELREELFGD